MKKTTKTKKEIFTLTPLGALIGEFGDGNHIPQKALVALELHARRFYQNSKTQDVGAIIFDTDGKNYFAQVHKPRETDKIK